MTSVTSKVQHRFARLPPIFLLLILQAWRGCCHPQCLDYKPPFGPRQPLLFCKEYSKFGCCDLEKDEEISRRFYNIMANFDNSGYFTCGRYIRSILCQVRDLNFFLIFNCEAKLCGHCSSPWVSRDEIT